MAVVNNMVVYAAKVVARQHGLSGITADVFCSLMAVKFPDSSIDVWRGWADRFASGTAWKLANEDERIAMQDIVLDRVAEM